MKKTSGMKLVELRLKEPIEAILRRLYYEEGLSLEAVGKRIDVPEGTVATWMIRLGLNQRAMADRAARERVS